MIDNSSGVSGGEILWVDIENIKVIEIHRQKIILVLVKNPQEYIDKQSKSFKRKLMKLNYDMYGTPLSIASNGLKISFDELFAILTSKINSDTNSNYQSK